MRAATRLKHRRERRPKSLPFSGRQRGTEELVLRTVGVSVVPGLDWQAGPMAVLDPKRPFDLSAARSARESRQVRWQWQHPYPACLLDGTG